MTSENRLYLVTLEYQIPVYARSRSEAVSDAITEATNDEEPDAHVVEIKDREHAERLGMDLDAFPWGGHGDWTAGELLDGIPSAPLPDAPDGLAEIGEWVSLRTHADAPESFDRFHGEGLGWRWWSDGRGVTAVPLPSELEPADPGKTTINIDRILSEPKGRSGTLALADLDGTVADVSRGMPSIIRIGDVALDARLLRRWVWGAAHAAGDKAITVEWSGALDPVRFRGSGWAAIVMPVADDYTIYRPELPVETTR